MTEKQSVGTNSSSAFSSLAVRFVLAIAVCTLGGLTLADTPPPSLPSTVNRYAWFGCESLTVNGHTTVGGVDSVGGDAGAGGDIASNGGITVTGSNTIDGNVTPGPGETVHITGTQNHISGSTDPAADLLPCEAQSVSDWAAYASANNNNGAIPTTFYKNGNFKINGNKTCTLPAGTYYVGSFMINGGAKLVVSGPVVFVATGSITINGSCQVNKDGDPGNLLLVSGSSSAVMLNGSAHVSLKVYAPLSHVSVNGSLTGYGNLWGESLTGNGSVVWNRVRDTTPPVMAIKSPADGTLTGEAKPALDVTYSDGGDGTGVDTSTLHVTLDGTEITDTLTVGDSEATGQPADALAEGDHTLEAHVTDYENNTASATSTFAVDTLPPVIAITGVEDGGLYGQAVTPQIRCRRPASGPGDGPRNAGRCLLRVGNGRRQ